MPTINGDSGSNYLEGTEVADQIYGLGGNDLIVALGGNDIIDGGADQDTIDAGAGDDTIYGGDGWDGITDGTGSDTVFGGAGSDRIYATPGAGNDVYDGGISLEQDWVDYSYALAGVIVDLSAASDQARSVGDSNAAGIGIDQLTEIECVVGSAFDDTLTGNSGANRLHGGNGNDILAGGDGTDVVVDIGGQFAAIDAGSGDDVITVDLQSTSSGQVTTILAGTGYDGLAFGMTGPGSAIIDMGEGGDNVTLTATPNGGTTITLGDSADLYSEAIHFAVDWFVGSSFGPITITDFDPGRSDGYIGLPGDFLNVKSFASGMLQGIGYDTRISPFDSGLMRLVQVGTDTILQVDMTGHGSFSDFVIFSNTQASEFTTENFSVSSLGPGPSQTIHGDSNANTLSGGTGADVINGQGGNDIINGGRGDDTLTGGAGSDIFVIARPSNPYDPAVRAGRDTITDFTPDADKLDLTDYGFRYFGDVLSRAYQDGANVVIRIGPLESVTLQNVQLSSLDASDFVGLSNANALAVLPGPEPYDPTIFRGIVSDNADVTISADQLLFGLFANGLITTSGITDPIGDLTNLGTLWVSTSDSASAVGAYGADNIVNMGAIYSVASSGDAWGFHFVGGFDTLNNSGTISVVSWQSRAIGIETFDFRSTITNSGTISARGNFDAYAIAYYNGVEPANESTTPAITNTATGRILSEGPGAVAIYLAQAPIYNSNKVAVNNSGLIEARSLSEDASVAILVGGHGSGGTANIINSGTISADIAYYTDPTFDPFFLTATNLTNETSGQIFGAIVFAQRADTLVNRGTITGNVFAGGGNDVVDTSDGRIIGYADLEQGDDQFVGSAYADEVYGGAGNDTLNGNGGDDFLEGGLGDDVLNGGSGFDFASYWEATSGVTVNLSLNGIAQNTGGDGVDTLASIEDLLGSSYDDQLTGSGNDNIIIGAGGADILTGGAGADYLEGGEGADTFKDTAAGLNGDTIADFALGERIVLTDAILAGFTFNLTGNTLTYSGGTLTLQGSFAGQQLVASAAAGGGVQLTLQADAPEAVRNDFNGDGRSDILWRSDSGQFSNWLANAAGGWVNNDANAFAAVPTSWQVTGTGDFNGDGNADVLWRSDSGQLSNWLGTDSGGFTNNDANAFAGVPTSWQVTGTGDFNGDGRDDILWRSDTGQLSNWLGTATGGFTNNDANAFAAVPTSWHVVGTGDFNGDGKDDILWRSDSGQLSNWLGTDAGGFTNNDANAFAAVPTSWHVAGTGDFNGDGRDDVLWRSDTGQLSNWLGTATGGFTNNDANAFAAVPTSWQVVAVGDYNGDGFDDLLWRSDSGQLSNWLGTASGGFTNNDANAFTAAPTSWHVQPVDPWI